MEVNSSRLYTPDMVKYLNS